MQVTICWSARFMITEWAPCNYSNQEVFIMSALCNCFSLFVIKRCHKQRPVYLAWLHRLHPENKAGLVLFRSRGILLYLDQVWADDGAAPGIGLVYLNTVFYPVFCISCWARLTRLYRSSGHVKSQAGEGKNTQSCKHIDLWKPRTMH